MVPWRGFRSKYAGGTVPCPGQRDIVSACQDPNSFCLPSNPSCNPELVTPRAPGGKSGGSFVTWRPSSFCQGGLTPLFPFLLSPLSRRHNHLLTTCHNNHGVNNDTRTGRQSCTSTTTMRTAVHNASQCQLKCFWRIHHQRRGAGRIRLHGCGGVPTARNTPVDSSQSAHRRAFSGTAVQRRISSPRARRHRRLIADHGQGGRRGLE